MIPIRVCKRPELATGSWKSDSPQERNKIRSDLTWAFHFFEMELSLNVSGEAVSAPESAALLHPKIKCAARVLLRQFTVIVYNAR